MTDNRKWRPKPETMGGTVKIPTTNLRFKTMYMWKIVLASEYKSDQYRYSPQTGNNYISRTLTDSVEIATPNSRFSNMTSSIKD